MKSYIYARKFAGALIDVEENREQLISELGILSQQWGELDVYIPMYLAEDIKKERLKQLGLMETLQNLILELSHSGKMRLLPRITEECICLNNERNNILIVKVTAKRKLTENECTTLTHVLHQKYNKHIELQQNVDPRVIDGLKIESNYHVFDDTVATKLDVLIQKLSYEMEAV